VKRSFFILMVVSVFAVANLSFAISVTENNITYSCNIGTGTASVSGYIGTPIDVTIPVSVVGTWIDGDITYSNSFDVTSVGSSAFYRCISLSSVSSPSATSIGWGAFARCSSLSSVSFPLVKLIAENDDFYGTFSSCSSLSSVSFPSATSIGWCAFYGCISLSSVSFPSATSIGNHAFSGCSDLSSVSFPSATSIGVSAFKSCSSLLSVSLPLVTSIGSIAFYDCIRLKEIIVGGNISVIEESTFANCYRLETVFLANSITNIEEEAFASCASLENIQLPSNLVELGMSVFKDCTSLQEVTIPYGVVSIPDGSFYDCYSLTTVIMPENLEDIGVWAFRDCRSLENIYFNGDQPEVCRSTFIGATLATVYYRSGATGWGVELDGIPTELWSGVLPVSATTETPVAVPFAWLTGYGLVSTVSNDYEEAAMDDVDQDGLTAWQEYVAGTDPTKYTDAFESDITMMDDYAYISWEPDLGTIRTYKLEGTSNLSDSSSWSSIPNLSNRFFRVKVSL